MEKNICPRMIFLWENPFIEKMHFFIKKKFIPSMNFFLYKKKLFISRMIFFFYENIRWSRLAVEFIRRMIFFLWKKVFIPRMNFCGKMYSSRICCFFLSKKNVHSENEYFFHGKTFIPALKHESFFSKKVILWMNSFHGKNVHSEDDFIFR